MNIHQVYKGKDANRVHNKPRPVRNYQAYRGGRSSPERPRQVWTGQAYRGAGGPSPARRALAALLCLVLLGAVCFGALLGVVLAGDHDEIRGYPGAMIVLGCQVKPWGPSILLQDRLDKALEYLSDHPDTVVVCSGGQGADEPVSESRCMADYLIAHGFPEGQILLEDRSVNTDENIYFSLRVLREAGYDTTGDIVVVSNGFHLARVRMLWGRIAGGTKYLSTLAAPSSHLPSRLKMYIREPIGLVKSFIFDGRGEPSRTTS